MIFLHLFYFYALVLCNITLQLFRHLSSWWCQFTRGLNYVCWIFFWYGQLFAAGRPDRDGPYESPSWGRFFVRQFSLVSPLEFPAFGGIVCGWITGPSFAAFGRVIPWNQVVNRYLHTTEIRLMRQGTADLMRIVGKKIFKTKS